MPEPRFVVLAHDDPFPHLDLMLERDGALATWRIRPPFRRGRALEAERLGDHRLDYLDHEGPVSGGRGTVRRVASGTCEIVAWGEGYVAVRLRGPGAGEWAGGLVLARRADGPWGAYFIRVSGSPSNR